MRPDRPKTVRDYTLLWLAQVKNSLEDAKKAGNNRKAFVACYFLAGGLSLATCLRLIRPKDIQHWKEYITAKSADLEYPIFGPNLEEGHTS